MSNLLENDNLRIEVESHDAGYSIGNISLKNDEDRRHCIDNILFFLKDEQLLFQKFDFSKEPDLPINASLSNVFKRINVDITFDVKNHKELIEFKITGPPKRIQKLKIKININFDKNNSLDYIALSGSKYQNVKSSEIINHTVNQIGMFSGIWSVCSKNSTFSTIIPTKTKIQTIQFLKDKLETNYTIHLSKETEANIYLFLGIADYIAPIKAKFLELESIRPLDYKADYKEKAMKAFWFLKHISFIKSPNGSIPANFIHYPLRKKDEIWKGYWCSYGNCFSLGAIYGLSALCMWSNSSEVNENLRELIKPVIRGAYIKEGPTCGSFFDTFFITTNTWTTGRAQFKEGGFSDWIPYKYNTTKRTGGMSAKEVLNFAKRDIILRKSEALKFFIWQAKLTKMAIPYMGLKIDKEVVYPAFSAQYAYFLLQTLKDSKNNYQFLSKDIENEIASVLDATAKFLTKYQRSDDLWDHELYIDGEVFWNKRTLACVFPATFLIWWGHELKNDNYITAGLKAIEKVNALQGKNEYYGMYFETDLAKNQPDLVTILACIKCYCKLYQLLKKEEYLDRAERAAWHAISKMWSNISDTKGNKITGGILVTTYKSMGFPVIGGSELCQCFEVFCELSFINPKYVIFAQALLGFCLTYLIREGKKSLGIYEIIFGYGDDWSKSFSADFASYASGPFIRGLHIFTKMEK